MHNLTGLNQPIINTHDIQVFIKSTYECNAMGLLDLIQCVEHRDPESYHHFMTVLKRIDYKGHYDWITV
ncbi:hypothetical protein CTM93_12450 [Photobacterium phosphoreum]|nr:hypothetical protein CTM93_12450 [Photobacterium phosphoreum]